MMQNNIKYKRKVFLYSILAVVLTIMGIGFYENLWEEKQVVGLIIPGNVTDDGWNGMHYDAYKKACETFDVTLQVAENIPEDEKKCKEAIEKLIDEGAQMILLGSFHYAECAKETIEKYQDVAFYCSTSEYCEGNLTAYFTRMYQARYLAGIVAGKQTKNNKIGYVAAMKNSEVNRGINAFTMGVKSVNPDAVVYVGWTDSWNDAKKEKAVAKDLIKQKKTDVISYHQNESNVIDVAEQFGVYSIGCHEAVSGYSDYYLTAAVSNWETVYLQIMKEYLQGNANATNNYWFGLEKNAVGLSAYSKQVSAETRKAVQKAQNNMQNGFEVFSDKIYDTQGMLRCDEGEVISDETLLREMDWYVEGVVFYENEK